MTTLGASSADNTIGENPAFEIAAELAFDMGWAARALSAVSGEFEPSGELGGLRGAVEPATEMYGSTSRRPDHMLSGRLRDQWHGMNRNGTKARLFNPDDEPQLSMHPVDIDWRTLVACDLAKVGS